MGGTVGVQGYGNTRRVEFPDGVDAPVSPIGRAALRYNRATGAIEVSVEAMPYIPLGGGGGVSPWIDDGGGNVRLQVLTNDVAIGAAGTVGTEKLRVIGDVRIESQVQVTELTSVPGSGLDLELSADTGNVTATVTGAGGYDVQNGVGTSLLQVLPVANEVVVGIAGTAIDAARFFATTTQVNMGVDAAALDVRIEGGASVLNIDTSGPTTDLTAGITGADGINISTFGTMEVSLDAIANAMNVREDGGPDYLNVSISAGSETVTIGNSTTNPDIVVDTGGDLSIIPPACLAERVGDPGATANTGKVYTKDVAAITELFFQDSAGNVVQMTSGGSIPATATPAGLNTQVQFNNAGAFGADADFTFDGTNVTLANALFAEGGLDRAAVGALALAPSNATSMTFGQVANPITELHTVPDNTADVWSVRDPAGLIYINVGTTNFSEFVAFGNSTTAPNYFFLGTNITMVVGSNSSGTVEAADFGPSPFSAFSRAMTVGAAVQATSITMGHSAAVLTIDSSDIQFTTGPLSITERVGDPGLVANTGRVYTKDVTAITELFYQDSSGNVVQLTSGGATVAGNQIPITDNVATAFRVFETVGGDNYFVADTTNGAEQVVLGNAVTNPSIQTLGSGIFFVGALGAGQLDVTSINADVSGGGHVLDIGTLAPTGTITIGRTAQAVVFPGGANFGASIGAGNGEVRTVGNVEVGGNIDKTSALPLSIGSGFATDLFLGRSGQVAAVLGSLSVAATITSNGNFVHTGSAAADTFDVLLPDNVANVFRVRQASGVYIEVDTTNAAELLTLGVASGFAVDQPIRLRGGTAGTTLEIEERTADPGGTANIGKLYVKDVSAVSLLFFQDSAGAVTQLTGATAATPTSVPIADNTALAYQIFEGGAGDNYFQVDTTNTAEEITFGNPTTDPDMTFDTAGVINLGIAGATIGVFGTAASGQAAAYTVTNPATRRSFDTTTVTLDELAETVGTIIADLESWGWFA